jgi:hypothetical protein
MVNLSQEGGYLAALLWYKPGGEGRSYLLLPFFLVSFGSWVKIK